MQRRLLQQAVQHLKILCGENLAEVKEDGL
jgi:hypothetical protein